MVCAMFGTGVLAGDLTADGQTSSLTGVSVKRRSRRGRTWQQAFWEAEAREAFAEIEAVAEIVPDRVVERAEALMEKVEAYAPAPSLLTYGARVASEETSARKAAEALIALRKQAERIIAARAAEQDDEEALLLLFG